MRILSFIISLLLIFPYIPNPFYTKKQLFADTKFKNGFNVLSQQNNGITTEKLGEFTYSSRSGSPEWSIAQWNSGPCLWADRVQSDEYTITDGLTKTVRYNPWDHSVSMRMNAANVYNGQPADDSPWPHLLLEQSPFPNSINNKAYCCDCDNIFLEMKIRISDFKDTTVQEGINAVQYLAYIYLKSYDGRDFVWFGVNLFDSRGPQETFMSIDTAGSNKMIYSLSTEDTFGELEKSLYRDGAPYVSDKWVKVRVDLKPHIDKMVNALNEQNYFASTLTSSDLYIDGTNIGFEVHGNFDCTVDIKDYSLTSLRF